MPFQVNNQAIVAFKHLLGKSNTDVAKGVNNEFEGIGLTITGENVWIETIDSNPAVAVAANVAVAVSCPTILDATSNGHALFAVWPVTPPTGIDPKTGLAFAYGTGTLINIVAGDRVRGAIPDRFGTSYLAQPFAGGNAIPVGDQRDWVYQYDSGIFFQEDGSNEGFGGSAYGHPDQIDLYVYIGDTVLDITGGGGGSEWYASATSIECDPPVSPTTGDRYLICSGPSPAASGAWTGNEDKIAEWSGLGWIYTEPTQGGTIQIDTEPGVYYLYTGANYPGGTWTRVPSTIVRIGTASGTDTYIATVDPPIVDYTNVVFIGVFDNANTGASTIDINGLGSVMIRKNDNGALVDLEANDIRSGIMYMLVHDGTLFQLYTGDLGMPLDEVLAKGNTTNGNEIILTGNDNIRIGSVAGNFLRYFSGDVQLHATAPSDSLELLSNQGITITGNTQVSIGVSSANINLSSLAMIVTDTANTKGLEYAADYTTNFTEHSLVTKGYVDATGGAVTPDNIPVAATFTATTGSPLADEYTGVATPIQTSYDAAVIYLVTFDTNNTGAARLNIDGLGYLELVKGDEILGLVSLDPNDIVASVVYYVVYDGIQLQVFETEPTQLPGTYTNLNPSTATVGGVVAGTTFSSMTYKDLFDMMFYPYILPQFTSFSIAGQSTGLEVGQQIASGNKTFNWSTSNSGNIITNTIRIRQYTGVWSWLIQYIANDGTEVINFPSALTRTTAGYYRWRIYAQRTNSSWFARNFTVNWYWRRFYGTSANATLTEADIEALTGNQLASGRAATYNFVAGDYKYFAFPTQFGEATLFKDVNTQLSVAMAGVAEGYTSGGTNGLYYQLVSVTNTYGVTTNYRVYRTRNVLGGTMKIQVS